MVHFVSRFYVSDRYLLARPIQYMLILVSAPLKELKEMDLGKAETTLYRMHSMQCSPHLGPGQDLLPQRQFFLCIVCGLRNNRMLVSDPFSSHMQRWYQLV